VSQGVSRKWGVLRWAAVPVVAASTLIPAFAGEFAGAAMTNGTIHIVSVGSVNYPQYNIVITGAIGDAGTYTIGNSPVLTLHLTKGTMKVNFAKGGAAENAIFSQPTKYTDASTCAFAATFSASYPIVSGTGAYAGAHGSVTLASSMTAIFPKLASGKCNLGSNAKPIGFLYISQGSGTVSIN